jgi:hypothetical protein
MSVDPQGSKSFIGWTFLKLLTRKGDSKRPAIEFTSDGFNSSTTNLIFDGLGSFNDIKGKVFFLLDTETEEIHKVRFYGIVQGRSIPSYKKLSFRGVNNSRLQLSIKEDKKSIYNKSYQYTVDEMLALKTAFKFTTEKLRFFLQHSQPSIETINLFLLEICHYKRRKRTIRFTKKKSRNLVKTKIYCPSSSKVRLLKKYKVNVASMENMTCPICLDDIKADDDYINVHPLDVKTPHIFHKKCIEDVKKNECPICRQPMTTYLVPK